MKSQENDPYTEQMLMTLTRKLLDSITASDWQTYADLCDPTITAFEPEARGHLVTGLAFHKYYFDLQHRDGSKHTTLCSPKVRMVGDGAAVVTYVRLTQYLDGNGQPNTSSVEETRVWQRHEDGRWRHVHFHRSAS